MHGRSQSGDVRVFYERLYVMDSFGEACRPHASVAFAREGCWMREDKRRHL